MSSRHPKRATIYAINPEAKITSSMKTRKCAPYACGMLQRQRTGLRVFGALDVARSAGLGGAGGPARARHGRAFFGFAQNRPRPAPLRFIFASGLNADGRKLADVESERFLLIDRCRISPLSLDYDLRKARAFVGYGQAAGSFVGEVRDLNPVKQVIV